MVNGDAAGTHAVALPQREGEPARVLRHDVTPQLLRMLAPKFTTQDPVARMVWCESLVRARSHFSSEPMVSHRAGGEWWSNERLDERELWQLVTEFCTEFLPTSSVLVLSHVTPLRLLLSHVAPNERQALYGMIQRRNVDEVQRFFSTTNSPNANRCMRAFEQMVSADSSIADLQKIWQDDATAGDTLAQAAEQFDSVQAHLVDLGWQTVVVNWLDALQTHYHSGVCFSLYMTGRGDEVARGGHYQSGEISAFGFDADLDALGSSESQWRSV